MMDLGPSFIFVLLLPFELEILAPSWAIIGAPAHLISILAWESVKGVATCNSN
jgi:hypothetical protein